MPVLFVLLLPLLLVRVFLFQPFNVPSTSMSPSINRGDYILVSKFTHRDHDPARGDIIVFHARSFHADFVKRVVGLPGDTVQMHSGVLFINGKPVARRRIADFIEDCGSTHCRIPQYEEFFPGGKTGLVLDREPSGPLDDTEIFVVPKNAYFVLGDNRDNSNDSRADIGYVPQGEIVGRPVAKYRAAGRLTWQIMN